MNNIPLAEPKLTSFSYGEQYQLEQVDKHRNRKTNHWKERIEIAHTLIDKYVLNRMPNKKGADITVLDVGCSIGTMAIEMANRGFTTYGVDFDESALKIAEDLSAEENAEVKYFKGDVAAWNPELDSKIDIAVCFDIFEHLHDDELGALLQSVKKKMDDKGALIFYTFPQQFDYLLYGRTIYCLPLILFLPFSNRIFERVVRAYAAFLDIFTLLFTGKSYKEKIKKYSHCNPTTTKRLSDILERSGFTVGHINTFNIYPFKPMIQKIFRSKAFAHRSIYGVAYPNK
jgi:2-polyprenyl-3-methyl-5-hydroxy-6-metoxy-1,4-benzoquinol methylase